MGLKSHAEIVTEEESKRESVAEASDLDVLRREAREFASRLGWLPGIRTSHTFANRSRKVRITFRPLLAKVDAAFELNPNSSDLRWFRDHVQVIYSELRTIAAQFKPLKHLPHSRGRKEEVVPRVVVLAQTYLDLTANRFQETTLTAFLQAFQENSVLELREVSAVVPALKLVLLERIASRARCLIHDPADQSSGLGACVRSLRDITQTSWKEILEPLISFDAILRRDPAGAYENMDFASRQVYRDRLSRIARHSDVTEMEVALEALRLAQQASTRSYRDPRHKLRQTHVGFYLVGEGRPLLDQKVGFRPNFVQSLRVWMRGHPDDFSLPGIAFLTFAIITVVLLFLTPADVSPGLLLLSMLVLLLPCSQAAVQVMSSLITALLPAEILPKLDFSAGVPEECVTLVAIPSLLLNEKQVRGLVEDLEVRFLGNHDRNIHFGLLTDLPDSDEPATEDSPLLDLCAGLIRQLNEKYGGQRRGSFFLLHRHRVFNRREKGWMGWERKRGKLLDLNKLLRGTYDSFPVKVGDVSILPRARYVITLDSDTELPRGAAHRLIGTLAHPLNRAIIDAEKNIVVAGYGILQPRVGVSVQSTARSRLAAIYAGETGFDIYTCAISDAYQDLYGEGSFTGKGIYEVDVVHRVLDRRFPRNALLSHDLIEGAYARAGLVSDVEVIEDYPSHYSAYNRRKHRWLRGDWQIVEWLSSSVQDESGARVANPISLVSRWKILDNLRRSLVEPATLLLLLFGWLVPGENALRWTLATIFILFVPPCAELLFSLIRAVVEQKTTVAREALTAFYTASFTVLLTLAFLAHQTLLSLDAVVRALVRRAFTREHLLEWETAAEAEVGKRRTPVDRYLDWMPLFAVAVGVLVWLVRPQSLHAALPILVLWAGSELVALWLNESPSTHATGDLPQSDRLLLRRAALHTWRYFSELCTEEHNWLVPDNIQQQPPAVAARISPTNLGLLLNARQAAVELGFLTVPELQSLTRQTLSTVIRMAKYGGHLLNWYDTRTLTPLPPLFVSSVDSGNLLASLWTLQHGCADLLCRPLLQPSLAEGLCDCLRTVADAGQLSRRQVSRCEAACKDRNWLPMILEFKEADFAAASSPDPPQGGDILWFRRQAEQRLRKMRALVEGYEPWWLPEFEPVLKDLRIDPRFMGRVPLQRLPDFIGEIEKRLAHAAGSESRSALYERFKALLDDAKANAASLIEELQELSGQAAALADAMDFSFLLDPRRKLMSIGFDTQSRELHNACYDLLATESRTAIFVAIAKEDILQDCWFRLGRSHTLDHGRPVLLSWTGTMFEYLMPSIWMRSYPNTLLDRAQVAAVRSQQAYAAGRNVPWGISESSCFKLDDQGNYHYHAFGLPQISLMRRDSNPLVISPYSTFLALNIDRTASLRNLRRMERLGWFGSYGFYESVDYSASGRRFLGSRCQVVPLWMAHHQGMSLLSLANLLCNNAVQRWFHSDRRVQATELLLHEKPVSHVRSSELPYRAAVA